MSPSERSSLRAVALSVIVGAGVAWAGSQGGISRGTVPVFAFCAALAYVINWAAFVPAYRAQTERYFDLTGSLTYVTVVSAALVMTARFDARALVLTILVAVWAARLGSFLFARIRRDGSDARFDELKPSLFRFFMTWTLQGLWVLLTVSSALAAITSEDPQPLGGLAIAGSLVWLLGFVVEAVADAQKRAFKEEPMNRGRFIRTGLWAWSRHPNYFGEITLWLGVAIVALPALSGWQYLTLVSPVFVYLLLTQVSGVPLLEARAEAKWGNDQAYQAYRDRTPVLFPRPPQAT